MTTIWSPADFKKFLEMINIYKKRDIKNIIFSIFLFKNYRNSVYLFEMILKYNYFTKVFKYWIAFNLHYNYSISVENTDTNRIVLSTVTAVVEDGTLFSNLYYMYRDYIISFYLIKLWVYLNMTFENICTFQFNMVFSDSCSIIIMN